MKKICWVVGTWPRMELTLLLHRVYRLLEEADIGYWIALMADHKVECPRHLYLASECEFSSPLYC